MLEPGVEWLCLKKKKQKRKGKEKKWIQKLLISLHQQIGNTHTAKSNDLILNPRIKFCKLWGQHTRDHHTDTGKAKEGISIAGWWLHGEVCPDHTAPNPPILSFMHKTHILVAAFQLVRKRTTEAKRVGLVYLGTFLGSLTQPLLLAGRCCSLHTELQGLNDAANVASVLLRSWGKGSSTKAWGLHIY